MLAMEARVESRTGEDRVGSFRDDPIESDLHPFGTDWGHIRDVICCRIAVGRTGTGLTQSTEAHCRGSRRGGANVPRQGYGAGALAAYPQSQPGRCRSRNDPA